MYVYSECPRCGIRREIAGKRNKVARCADCKATRVEKIKYGQEECLPWGGDFDELDNPVLDGNLYLAGDRLCGHRDCVRADHVALIVEPLVYNKETI